MNRITVIMGIYNCATTLEEALDSLENQTYKEFKVVLCDDGSTDNSYEVAKRYATHHNNIILIRNEKNMGLNYTLNHCLEYADTEYVARMDGDDRSLPMRFEQELRFLDSHPEYAIVSGPMKYFDENGVFRIGRGNGEVKPKDFRWGNPIYHAPCMVRKEAFDKVDNYTVDKRLLRVEDYHLWFKMYATGFKGYVLPEPIYEMRDDANAIRRRNWRNRISEVYVKLIGFRMLHLPFYYYIFLLKPIISGLLPLSVYKFLHRK